MIVMKRVQSCNKADRQTKIKTPRRRKRRRLPPQKGNVRESRKRMKKRKRKRRKTSPKEYVCLTTNANTNSSFAAETTETQRHE